MRIVNDMYGYEIIPEEQLVIEIITGSINLESMKEFKQEQISDRLYSKKYDLLSVHINSRFEGLISELAAYVDFLKVNGLTEGRKAVSVFDTPNQLVYVTTLFNQLKLTSLNLKMTDSVEKGLEYLNKQSIKDKVNDIIEAIYSQISKSI